jgi:hypothetical protein
MKDKYYVVDWGTGHVYKSFDTYTEAEKAASKIEKEKDTICCIETNEANFLNTKN